MRKLLLLLISRRMVVFRSTLLLLITVLLYGCTYGDGELHGVENREVWYEPQPFGMAFIKMGSYNMGPNDQDISWAMTAESKTVSVPPFWMDITEITNNEYRQFVYWVRDSLVYTRLMYVDFDDSGYDNDFYKVDDYTEEETTSLYTGDGPPGLKENPDDFFKTYAESRFINWEAPIPWDVEPTVGQGSNNKEIWDAVKGVYYQGDERFYDRWELDGRMLNYVYYWVDLEQASKIQSFKQSSDGNNTRLQRRKAFNWDSLYVNYNVEDLEAEGKGLSKLDLYSGTVTIKGQEFKKSKNSTDTKPQYKNGQTVNVRNRGSYIMKDIVNVYPDTLCWISDFTYSYNDPMTKMYFWHPAYDNYPVVGVNWKQATAFGVWRTNLRNHFLKTMGESFVQDFELPTESQWEYAARGGLKESMYPWGGYYTTNMHGCYITNFKPMRGNYPADGGFYPVIVAINAPNDYGLYDMAGNVAEWTSNAFDEAAYSWTDDLSPDYHYNALPKEQPEKKRKVIRGGSWKDIAYYLQCGTRTYEFQDTSKSYIGFRNVRAYLGRDMDDSGESNVY